MIQRKSSGSFWTGRRFLELFGLGCTSLSHRHSSLGRESLFGRNANFWQPVSINNRSNAVGFPYVSIPRNDFDWSEVSMAPGDGWGEYVEEYEAALCVSLDIDHGFRWDTR